MYSGDSKAHGAKMGRIWGRQDPAGPHVGPMNLPILVPIHIILALNGLFRPVYIDWIKRQHSDKKATIVGDFFVMLRALNRHYTIVRLDQDKLSPNTLYVDLTNRWGLGKIIYHPN